MCIRDSDYAAGFPADPTVGVNLRIWADATRAIRRTASSRVSSRRAEGRQRICSATMLCLVVRRLCSRSVLASQ
eukprot:3499653-Prorocentrum_lima.AAC.1